MHAAPISKSPDRIAAMFDAIAGRYDFLNHFLSAGIDRRWRRRAVRSLRLTGGERVLDLCTGTGDLAILAVRSQPGPARVVGVDFAGAMLRVAHTKIQRAGLSRHVALVRGDATRLPIAAASVDAVTIAFGIRNVEHGEEACAEMGRVLKPGGRLAMLEFAVPAAPVWRHCYGWYLKHVLPAVGRLVSHHPAAYGYLPASINAFARPDEVVKILRHAGFVDVSTIRLTFGSVCLYMARRAADILVTS
jgi:demethylmenaquinone methyltransferase/2-methoxy-6-polyprenyl-1,4-benzoquinol methylase